MYTFIKTTGIQEFQIISKTFMVLENSKIASKKKRKAKEKDKSFKEERSSIITGTTFASQ